MKLGLLNNKTAEDSSSPSTSLPSNMAVPPPTTNPVATLPLPISVVPQKVSKPSNMKKSVLRLPKQIPYLRLKIFYELKKHFYLCQPMKLERY